MNPSEFPTQHPHHQLIVQNAPPFEESLETLIERWLQCEVGLRAQSLLASRRTAILNSLTSLDPSTQATEIARAQGQLALIEYLTSPTLKSDLLA